MEKGPGRPFFSEHLRAEALSHLSIIDAVIINSSSTATDIIKKLNQISIAKVQIIKKIVMISQEK